MIRGVEADEFRRLRGGLVDLYLEAYRGLEEYAYRRRSDVKDYLQWLYKIDPKGFLVAEDKGEVLGFVAACRQWWDKNQGLMGEIHEIAVPPAHQGRGIGSRLLEEALNVLKREHRVFGLWVGERNFRAQEFYRRRGFAPVGRLGKWIRMIRRG